MKKIILVLAAGLAASAFLAFVYFGTVSLVESSQHAIEFFWQDRWIVIPIILGFGVQVALYVVLKFRWYLPVENTGSSASMMGASGTTSAIAMLACCAHHMTDALPVLGLTAASAFLAKYRFVFMEISLGITLLGIGYILLTLAREKRKNIQVFQNTLYPEELP